MLLERLLFRKNDLFIIGTFILVFILIQVIISFTRSNGSFVQVSIDGKVVETFMLSEDLEYVIKGYDGGMNTLVIEDGAAYLKDTSCPDHLCENMGKISKTGQSIICLPNRVVVEITSSESEPEYDTVAGG